MREIQFCSKTILITGANGCIGTHLVKRLVNTDNLKDIPKTGNISFLNLDITNSKELLQLENIDIIIHLAAKVHEKAQSEKEKEEFYLVNTKATENLYKLGLKNNIDHFIFSSTIAVYGSETKSKVSETSEINPKTAYAKSKYQAEKVGLGLYQHYDFPITTLRLATVYGEFDRGNYKSLIDFSKKGIVPFIGGGDAHKAVVYVKDVVNLIIKIIKNNKTYGETYIVAEDNYKYKELISIIEKVFEINIYKIKIPNFIISAFERMNIDIALIDKLITLSNDFKVSNQKMKEKLNFKPEYSFYDGLKDSYDYYD